MSILAAYANTGTILNNYSEAFVQGNYSEVTSALAGALTEPQRNVWDSGNRFKLLCSGRRFGKTYLCITRLIC